MIQPSLTFDFEVASLDPPIAFTRSNVIAACITVLRIITTQPLLNK